MNLNHQISTCIISPKQLCSKLLDFLLIAKDNGQNLSLVSHTLRVWRLSAMLELARMWEFFTPSPPIGTSHEVWVRGWQNPPPPTHAPTPELELLMEYLESLGLRLAEYPPLKKICAAYVYVETSRCIHHGYHLVSKGGVFIQKYLCHVDWFFLSWPNSSIIRNSLRRETSNKILCISCRFTSILHT